LHIGYHYCRDYNTRHLCQKNYDKFINEYKDCIDDIDDNYYVIADKLSICIKTYESIYKHEKFNFTHDNNNTIIKNIQGKPIVANEKVINSEKAKNTIKKKY
jgi:hypothetical protein